ncbi:hypothetical protein CP8484711_1531 [Chlamydia psittaci 84-8471/1]|nr:hypothetical protein CP8484711_1531 [Chlamydia psittaci 84-8471/1]
MSGIWGCNFFQGACLLGNASYPSPIFLSIGDAKTLWHLSVTTKDTYTLVFPMCP